MAVDPNYRTLRCRAKELLTAATSDLDSDSHALFLFYAVECGLKALYMDHHKLATASTEGSRARSAKSYGHRLDDLLGALRVPPQRVPPRPQRLCLRNGDILQVMELHEAWRYGEKVDAHTDVVEWLETAAIHVRQGLR